MEKNKLLIITGASASGKTTLQDELLKRGWKRPLNFTTRQMRSEKEMDEYVFLKKERMMYLLEYGAFLEFTNGYGDWYAISVNLPNGDVCIVLDPTGREQVLQKMARMKHNYDIKCLYLDVNKELQTKRLKNRGDTPENIKIRGDDFKFFSPNGKSFILEGAEPTVLLANEIENKWEILKKT